MAKPAARGSQPLRPPAGPATASAPSVAAAASPAPIESHGRLGASAAIVVLAGAIGWAYWPILVELERTWHRQPDYSHGYLVAPLAVCFLWARRSGFPGLSGKTSWGGLVLLTIALAARIAGALWYVRPLEHWSLPICIAGAVWFLCGRATLRWSLPALAFLAFMLPLPYRAERSLSLPLQHVATRISSWMLQCLGEPAVAEGNVIVMHDARLLVAEACSGMRIFISVLALGYAYAVLLKKPGWNKACLLLAILPTAIVVNALRITITGLLQTYLTGETAHRFAHDVSGWLMLPVAAALLALVPWYLTRLVVEIETANPPDLLFGGAMAQDRAH